MELPYSEPFKIKMVETIRKSTFEQRKRWIKDVKFNLFKLKSEQVYIDLLTDSGTGAMSDKQWSEIMLGDESYAGATSYYKLQQTIFYLLGFEYFLPVHQGRAAENVLFSTLIKADDIIPGNTHFDTTKGHIEFHKAQAIDCTIDEAFDTKSHHQFKGNVDLDKLEILLKEHPKSKIPFIIVTLTCNSTGGQPVSLENMKGIRQIADKYGIPVYFDSARFAENAYFIKMREKGYENKTIREIVWEMFSYADGMTMSAKKDGLVNIGGFIGLRNEEVYKRACVYNILFEGYITYGGMAGRDMGALAQGLKEVVEFDYLESRIKQVAHLGQKLKDYNIPVQEPFGGHAIFIDVKRFFPHIPQEEYPAQVLGVRLYIEGGVRGVEVGTLLADRDPVTRQNRYPNLELLRLAIPRRVYTNNHMDYVAVCLANIWEKRERIRKGFKILYEAPIMRHFTVELGGLSEFEY
jgi:tryptophanase